MQRVLSGLVKHRVSKNPLCRKMSRQTWFLVLIWLIGCFTGQIVDPPLVRFQCVAARQGRRKIHPAQGIPDRMHFIADMGPGILAHGVVEVAIHDEVVQVFGYSLVIASFHQETTLAMFDLERNAPCKRCDYRFALESVVSDLIT